jgi:hypothetical protein
LHPLCRRLIPLNSAKKLKIVTRKSMLPVSAQSLQLLLCVWLVILCGLLLHTWNTRKRGIGLALSYFSLTSIIHVPGAFAYAMPNYQPQSQYLLDSGISTYFVLLGFESTILALIAFFFGTLCVAGGGAVKEFGIEKSAIVRSRPHVAHLNYRSILISIFAFLVFISPLLAAFPSLTSIGVSVVMISVVVVSVACYDAWLRLNLKRFFLWVLGSLVGFPLVTLILFGFIGYGVIKSASVLAFVTTFYRPRWAFLLGGILISYLGLSFYVGYMRERESVRESVWGGQSLITRLERMAPTITEFTLFNPTDNEHLEYLDMRLNQNFLLGSCVDFMRKGGENFTGSSELWVLATAWIPRIFWPDKPVVAGSYGMVTRYTNLKFSEGTSVGIGHIMELFTYYGMWSVFGGMFLMGWVVRWFDVNAWNCFQRGDYFGFGRLFLIGAAMLDVGSNIPTMVASMASSLVLCSFIAVIFRFYGFKFEFSGNLHELSAASEDLVNRNTRRSGR